MKIKSILFVLMILNSVLFSQNYSLEIVTDEASKNYIDLIKKETKSMFPSDDNIIFNLKICDQNCYDFSKNKRKVFLLKNSAKYKEKENNYIVSYNSIFTIYDENKIIRMTALAIYEFLKENKSNSVYIKNEEFTLTSRIEENKSKKILDLQKVFKLAKENNIIIKQNLNTIKIDDLDINIAKSSYKPKIDVFSNYTLIDDDRAKYSSGLYSEGTLNAGLTLSQLIYSNKVLQNIKIKKLLSKSTQDEVNSLNDEIMYKVTLVYLNIIKAKKTNEIIRINQNFINTNLIFAKQRVEIGVQDRSDILRWESELANIGMNLANVKQKLNSLKIELANLLQIKNDFDIYEYGMNSTLFKLTNQDAIKLIENKKVQANFFNNIINTHSNLKQLQTLEEIKKEELQMNKSSRYMPTVAFQGSATKILDRDGEGKDVSRAWDDKEYQATLNINIPLYEGGIKSTKIQKNKIELINLKLQYKHIKNLIVENIKKNFGSLKRSYEKIQFAKISEEASRKNFELIQDKYKNGKENIITLLDAQDEYIISKLNLNISTIEYLSDLSSIYFFSGNIDILIDPKKKIEVEKNMLNILKGRKNDEN
ncbi:TolC family protein [Arcobacteraceae bacterium]|nr:TolC family protein [Arcobacteraceae bacterium]